MISEQHGVLDAPARKAGQGWMTRRSFLERAVGVGVGSSAALSLLGACGVGPGGSSASITYWNLFGGGDGVRMVEMQDSFIKSHPNINLEAVTLAWGEPYYTKLAMAAVGGRPPDVAISHMTRVPIYAEGGLLDPFDLDELAKYGITQDLFLPAIWERSHYNGQLYTIPLDTHPLVMYYNVDICERAGLLDSTGNLVPIDSPESLIDVFKKAQQVTGNLGLALDTHDVQPWRVFYSFYSQLGGTVGLPAGGEMELDTAKAEQALSLMADMTITSKIASPVIDYGGAVALFGSGQAGFHWNGEWEITTFLNQKDFRFNMVPFPQVFDQYRVQADSHSFVLPRQASVDPLKRAASLEFISYMLKESLTWAQGGHIPAYLPLVDSADYKNLKPQSNYAIVAADTVVDPTAWFSGSGSDFEVQAGSAFQAVLAGQITPQEGLSRFRAAVNKLLKIPTPI